jgi:hypothetical protein
VVIAQARCQALTGCHSLEGLGEHKQILPSDTRQKCLAPKQLQLVPKGKYTHNLSFAKSPCGQPDQ